MRFVTMPHLRGPAMLAPIVARVVIGSIMAAHGWSKLQDGPANFGNTLLTDIGVPAPVFTAYVITFLELVGGIALIVGLLSRVFAVAIVAILAVATLAVKTDYGFLSQPKAQFPGAELDLALIAGALVIALLGPGRISLDFMLGIEREEAHSSHEQSALAADQSR